MPCAVITGASSGLGQEYARYIARTHPEIDRFYFIARREERLEALKRELHRDAVILPLDLTQDESYAAISRSSARTSRKSACLSATRAMANMARSPASRWKNNMAWSI